MNRQTQETTMTKTEARKHFRLWWADVKAANNSEGGFADRAKCWDDFVEVNIAEGNLPETARDWVRDA